MNGKGFGAFGKERPAGPIKSIFILIIRVLLIGLFLYVTYLGFVWRKPPIWGLFGANRARHPKNRRGVPFQASPQNPQAKPPFNLGKV